MNKKKNVHVIYGHAVSHSQMSDIPLPHAVLQSRIDESLYIKLSLYIYILKNLSDEQAYLS